VSLAAVIATQRPTTALRTRCRPVRLACRSVVLQVAHRRWLTAAASPQSAGSPDEVVDDTANGPSWHDRVRIHLDHTPEVPEDSITLSEN